MNAEEQVGALPSEVQIEKALRAKIRKLTAKIVEHYKVIENIRKKDRELWKEYSRRLEELEELKSARGKKRKYAIGSKPSPTMAQVAEVQLTVSTPVTPRKISHPATCSNPGSKNPNQQQATQESRGPIQQWKIQESNHSVH